MAQQVLVGAKRSRFGCRKGHTQTCETTPVERSILELESKPEHLYDSLDRGERRVGSPGLDILYRGQAGSRAMGQFTLTDPSSLAHSSKAS